MDKHYMYFFAKTIAITTSVLLFLSAKADITLLVISALSFACVFVLELLLKNVKNTINIQRITIAICIIACFFLGIEQHFPLFILLLIELLDITVDAAMFYSILAVIVLLSYLIFEPNRMIVAITLILVTMLLLCRYLLLKMTYYMNISEQQKESLTDLNQKLNDIKSLTKTLKYKASVEERNRIAARIHDQVGHGISGSIIMLEAALLTMKGNPQKAEESIKKAVANLRDGVDEIRASLREERVEQYLIGRNDITAMLEEFRVTYHKSVEFKTNGDLDVISLEIWACIHDNTKECLTNLLKHSNATKFTINIDIFKKIIKVEYKDNGSSGEYFEKGLGLEAMEERTINAKGRCFWSSGTHGFTATNIFSY